MTDSPKALEWDAPSPGTVSRYVRALTRRRREHAHRAEEAASMLRVYESLDDRIDLEAEPEGSTFREARARVAGNAADAQARVASTEALIARAKEDPASLFLPVGALVRMKVPSRPETWRGGREAPPRAGTPGVVVGPAFQDSEWSTKVAFLDFEDDRGGRWSADADNPRTFFLDADDVEVVAFGRFLDGEACRSVDFVQTHARPEDGDAKAMVVVANGIHWVVEPLGEGRDLWLHVQGWDSVDDLDYLVPLGEEPGSPQP